MSTSDAEGARERRRNHANIEAMQNLIFERVARENDAGKFLPLPPLLRNYVSAIQSSHGGGAAPNEPFERSHMSVASYMQFDGDRATKEQRVRRLKKRLNEYQKRAGYLFVHIKDGGEPVGEDGRGNVIYSATRYTDLLKPVADAAVMRARASALWRGDAERGVRPHPGRALAAQVEWAVAQLPRSDEAPGEEKQARTLPLSDYERQSEEQLLASVEKRADGIVERGGDDDLWLEKLEVEISRIRRSRLKTRGVLRSEELRAVMREREAEDRAEDERLWEAADTPPTEVTAPHEENPAEIEGKPDMLAAALDYAGRGVPVFPVKPNKAPYTPRGFKDATTDEATIRERWRRWPRAGVGVPTGFASGWLVLDSDPRHGGDVSLCELIEAYGELPETLEAETGGGGHHIVFDFPELAELGNSRGRLPVGLDVRGEGGYVIVAPTLHESGRRYRWRNDFPPAPAPEWFIKLLTEDRHTAPLSDGEPRPQAKSGARIGAVIAEGGRNDKLFIIASAMRGQGAEYDEILSELLDINARRCSPPLDDAEVEKIARSAAKLSANRVAVGA